MPFQSRQRVRRNGQFERAIECYRDCIARQPDHILALNNLGSVLGATGRLEESVESSEQAVLAVPDRAVAHKNLGSVLLAFAGLMRRSMRLTNRAFDSIRRTSKSGSRCANRVQGDRRDREDAVECDRRAIALQPNLAVAGR